MTDQLQTEDVALGEGDEARSGHTVVVHYVGTLTDGQKFDSSRDRGEPFQFTLGAGEVIAGWDQGVAGMRVGVCGSLSYHLTSGTALTAFRP